MRKVLLFFLASLAACATNPAATAETGAAGPIPVHGVTPGHKCDATGTDRYIGQTRTRSRGAAIKRSTRAAVLRWAPPNTMLTMDYREDRVTVWLDSNRKITKIRCG